jgi:hypothetical protein
MTAARTFTMLSLTPATIIPMTTSVELSAAIDLLDLYHAELLTTDASSDELILHVWQEMDNPAGITHVVMGSSGLIEVSRAILASLHHETGAALLSEGALRHAISFVEASRLPDEPPAFAPVTGVLCGLLAADWERRPELAPPRR